MQKRQPAILFYSSISSSSKCTGWLPYKSLIQRPSISRHGVESARNRSRHGKTLLFEAKLVAKKIMSVGSARACDSDSWQEQKSSHHGGGRTTGREDNPCAFDGKDGMSRPNRERRRQSTEKMEGVAWKVVENE